MQLVFLCAVRQAIGDGLLTLFCAHTLASLVIQENAALAARRDLEDFFARIAPEDRSLYTHNDEGSDDMPAHIRTALTQTQLSIPVQNGRMMLGHLAGYLSFRASARAFDAPDRVAPDRRTGLAETGGTDLFRSHSRDRPRRTQD